VVFIFASINVLHYIYRFAYVEPHLHPWDEADLVMRNDFSDMLLDSFCHILLRIFASMFIKEIHLQFSFLEVSLSGFGISVILASKSELGSVPSLCISWKSLRRVGISSLKVR
jgi:hypothetical protein